jgi:hypothetical protein
MKVLNRIKNKVWLAVLLLSGINAGAQQAYQYTYTIDDGLLSAEGVSLSFAQNGELWLKYSNAEFLSRFDGINWMHYSLSELGLPLGISYLTEDQNGIWFFNHTPDFLLLACLTKSGQWKKFDFNGQYFDFPDLTTGEMQFLDDKYYVYRYDAGKNSFVRSNSPVIRLPENETIYWLINLNGTLIVYTKNSQNKTISTYYGEKLTKIPEFSNNLLYINYVKNTEVRGSITIDNQLYWYAGHQKKPLDIFLPNGRKGRLVDRAFLNKGGKVTLLSLANGLVIQDPTDESLYLYELDSLGNAHLHLSQLRHDYYKSSFSIDRQGNWWYGTSNGLVRTDNSQINFSEQNKEMVNGLHAIGEDSKGRIWMGGYNGLGGFSVFDGTSLHHQSFSDAALPILPGFLKSKSGTMYFFAETTGLNAIKEDQFLPVTGIGRLVGYYFLQLSNGKIAMGLTDKGLGIASENKGNIDTVRLIGKDKGMLLDNVLTVAEDQVGRLWVGRSSQGIALYDPQRDTAITWLRSSGQSKSIGTMSSCIDEKGTLWLGANKGLYRLEQAHQFDYLHNNLFDHIQEVPLPGQDSSMVNFLKNTTDYLVFGTAVGVYFYDKKYSGSRPRIFSLRYGKDINGGGSEQNTVLQDSKGFLWVGSQQGATRIDLSLLKFDTSATVIRLVKFQAGDITVGVDGYQLGKIPSDKRNIRFWFSPSGNTLLKDNLYYDIAIVNGHGDTLFSRISVVEKTGQVDYLPQGDYTLYITAYKNNVISGTAAFQFVIPMLLGENPWFWLILTTLLLSIPFLWFWFHNRQQKLLLLHQVAFEQSKRERDGLKIQVLSNFFNPHFINNALHWVQSKYRKDSETAVIVGRLAENVDILFSNTQSGKAFHSLGQELEIVKNYLKIQQVRFGRDLSTHLSLPEDPKVLNSVMIPSMLLQIHAENAIEKGIRNRKDACRFSIIAEDLIKGFRISIEDDGRGRGAETDEQTSHRRSSTLIMEDLIALLNTYNRENITVRYEDFIFREPSGVAYGTRVIIYIPKDYQYEFS